MAFLIGSQRNAIDAGRLKALPRAWRTSALRLAILLRLAALLNRSRKESNHPPVTIEVAEKSIRISFDAKWLARNPLTIADLERERGYLDSVGYKLELC
jgi:exopolyphosphatase/guanosine-5'-triphosphate,3'-diphosphate pyrophosphatase